MACTAAAGGSSVAAGRSPRMSHGAADLSSPTAAGYDEESRFAAQQNGAPRLQGVHAWQQPLAGASTQLATGDFEIEEEEHPDGTQPADDHDMYEATQGADDRAEADCARFVLQAGPREAPASFEVPWEHGAKVELGRASGTAAGAQRIVPCRRRAARREGARAAEGCGCEIQRGR